MRLYSSNHASCVGVGEVQDETTSTQAERRWTTPRRRARRVVVKLSEALVPAAFIPHKGAPSVLDVDRVTMNDVLEDAVDKLVLWDVAHVRLASDWVAPPVTPAPSANGNDSAAYDDDADFFAVPAPSHVVQSRGKVLSPSMETLSVLTPTMWHRPTSTVPTIMLCFVLLS